MLFVVATLKPKQPSLNSLLILLIIIIIIIIITIITINNYLFFVIYIYIISYKCVRIMTIYPQVDKRINNNIIITILLNHICIKLLTKYFFYWYDNTFTCLIIPYILCQLIFILIHNFL